ncbi:hypothetical protein MRX96_044776 [Rhipicephalus microplus]
MHKVQQQLCASQRISGRLQHPRLVKLWLVVPVLVGVILLVLVSMLLLTPLPKPIDGRAREIYVRDSTLGAETSDAGGSANATTDAAEDGMAVDLEKLLANVVEVEPEHFWANFSADPVTPELPRS